MTGITIVSLQARTNGQDSFYLLLTDRGILLSYGSGKNGCLGHGDLSDVARPKIVESLLGDEVREISCSDHHVGILTTDNEVFVWGNDPTCCGCLGCGEETNLILLPKRIDIKEEDGSNYVDISCGSDCTALSTDSGALYLAGNLLPSDSKNHYEFNEIRLPGEEVLRVQVAGKALMLLVHIKDGGSKKMCVFFPFLAEGIFANKSCHIVPFWQKVVFWWSFHSLSYFSKLEFRFFAGLFMVSKTPYFEDHEKSTIKTINGQKTSEKPIFAKRVQTFS